MFYASVSNYGCVSYKSLNGTAYTFYAFKTKQERDEFVEDMLYSSDGYFAEALTRKELASAMQQAGYHSYQGVKFCLKPVKNAKEPNKEIYTILSAYDCYILYGRFDTCNMIAVK